MKTKTLLFLLLAGIITPLAAQAQATRTWVSGVGDDANPCSRTAPGKTFAGAISKTAPAGEIDALDPGGFGAVTITKSITIDGGGGQVASILVASTNGLVISAGDTDVIVLRNIRFEGLGNSLSAIKVLKAGAVHIENCVFNGFQVGIDFQSSSPNAQLFVKDCTIHKCSVNGVNLAGTATATSSMIENTTVEGCAKGFLVTKGSATLKNSTAAGNSTTGFETLAGAGMTLVNCNASANAIGARSAGSIFITGCTIVGNSTNGLLKIGAGQIFSGGNNQVAGNTPDGAPTSTKAPL